MNIVLLILGLINLAFLFLIFKNLTSSSRRDSSSDDFTVSLKSLEERQIKILGAAESLDHKLSTEFRENRQEIRASIHDLQTGNERKLDQMRETVDEKLKSSVEKRFNESFSVISKQLTDVYKGLGEMKDLATGVGDLKKVMEGVKTRGNYGEVQLGSLISDILPASQYSENIITKKGTSDRVEFAINLPGTDSGTVYLPIDSKFPVENYQRLLDAYDTGDKGNIEKFRKALATDVREQAKKISTKYLDPPHTTAYAIMFLPTESLYAEVYRIPGLAEKIRRDFSVTISSPSTLPMVLNALLTGFKTLAIEQRSAEVWNTLASAKTEFGKFGTLLENVQKKLESSATEIEKAKKSSKRIENTLKDVETLPDSPHLMIQ